MKTAIKTSKHLIAVLALCALMFGSCFKEIDSQIPETQLSDATFWITETHLIQGTNYLYTLLPGIGENNNSNWSDDGRGSGNNSISDGSRLEPLTSGDWNGNYSNIRAANNVLERAAEMTISEQVKARYMSEARFFRAFFYMELIRRFGDVPLILQTMNINDVLLTAPRTNRESVVSAIYADLDEAVLHLPNSVQLPPSEYGRITQEACLALKARVALFEGTFNKYHGLPNVQSHLSVARASAESIMQAGTKALFEFIFEPDSSYFYLFRPFGNLAREEVILPRLYGENPQNPISTHSYPRNLQDGSTTPTRAIMDAYLYIDGLPNDGPNRSPLYRQRTNTLSEFEDRDPRMGMTVYKRGDFYTTNFYIPTFQSTQTGYKLKKWHNGPDDFNNFSVVHYKILRYAEVLLTFAEASYELNGSITDQELNQSINLTRARAGMPALTNAFVSTHGLNMLEEIRRERRVELAFEGGHRYWDILRWSIAEDVLPPAQLGIQYFPQEYTPGTGINNPQLDANGYIISQSAAIRSFNPARDYLWPLPVQQLGLNPNLTQNANWR
ncbi:RagB/SusD family nutrient uptake outer membrane protein [Sphingobacterium sp. lm-10]|uniref:RagB/SusD family nutrient uptake outer membrane protein n=1 Tax=Sphingobacterium sp. lm-10 TaxID=2944904 RepID=UPI002021A078|nr:RagB/SusD family nutrient uptake outer membrane protein [Sphingobacterium sp. lm-10]MCL7989167.1 RagB/SusD family nutrient uptake outer membrane protein [Sphingobacterium sp. lm-10]